MASIVYFADGKQLPVDDVIVHCLVCDERYMDGTEHICPGRETVVAWTGVTRLQVIHDIVNPETGKSYKDENLEKVHSFPVGSLVEFVVRDNPYYYDFDHDMDGVRLFVVHHSRDCDGTPLYCLSASRDDTKQERPGFANHSWVNGYPEDALTLVCAPKGQ